MWVGFIDYWSYTGGTSFAKSTILSFLVLVGLSTLDSPANGLLLFVGCVVKPLLDFGLRRPAWLACCWHDVRAF